MSKDDDTVSEQWSGGFFTEHPWDLRVVAGRLQQRWEISSASGCRLEWRDVPVFAEEPPHAD